MKKIFQIKTKNSLSKMIKKNPRKEIEKMQNWQGLVAASWPPAGCWQLPVCHTAGHPVTKKCQHSLPHQSLSCTCCKINIDIWDNIVYRADLCLFYYLVVVRLLYN